MYTIWLMPNCIHIVPLKASCFKSGLESLMVGCSYSLQCICIMPPINGLTLALYNVLLPIGIWRGMELLFANFLRKQSTYEKGLSLHHGKWWAGDTYLTETCETALLIKYCTWHIYPLCFLTCYHGTSGEHVST